MEEFGYYDAGRPEAPAKPDLRPVASWRYSIGVIAGATALGVFVVWLARVGWVLELIAWLLGMGIVAAGFATVYFVYKALSDSEVAFRQFVRILVAVVLGVSVTLALFEVASSHKLVYYMLHSSDDDDE